MIACPDLDVLEGLARGESDDAALRTHVEGCASCSGLMVEIAANLSAVVRWERLPHPASEATEIAPTIPGLDIEAPLSSGGQGIVWRAVQRSTNRVVAVKTLRRGSAASASARDRFAREARLGAALRHPNLVTVLDAGETSDGRLYLVMEFVDGVALDAGPAPSVDEAMARFTALADAVRFAHQRGVLHRDLKPANILLDADGAVRILDFGLAKAFEAITPDEQTTQEGTFIGTLSCAAPEQLRGELGAVDVRTDLFQLGVVFYHHLTGQWPHAPVPDPHAMLGKRLHEAPPRPQRLRPGLSADGESILLRLLAPSPEDRYPTAHDLWLDLDRLRRGEPIVARAEQIRVRLARVVRRYRAAMIAGAVVVLAMLVGSIVIWSYAEAAERSRAEMAREYDRAEEALGVLTRSLDAFAIGPAGPRTPMVDFLDHLVTELQTAPTRHPEGRVDLLVRAAFLYARIADPAQGADFLDRALAVVRESGGDADRELDLRQHALRLRLTAAPNDPALIAALPKMRADVAAGGGESELPLLRLDLLAAWCRAMSDPSTMPAAYEDLVALRERGAALPAEQERDDALDQADCMLVLIGAGIGRRDDVIERGNALRLRTNAASYEGRLRRIAVLQTIVQTSLDGGGIDLAVEASKELVDLADALLGERDRTSALAAFSRALALHRSGDRDGARPWFLRVTKAHAAGTTIDPSIVVVACGELGAHAANEGRHADAAELLGTARGAAKQARPGQFHPHQLLSIEYQLAQELEAIDRKAEAAAVLREALPRAETHYGKDDELTLKMAEALDRVER